VTANGRRTVAPTTRRSRLNVDFEVAAASQVIDEHHFKLLQSGAMTSSTAPSKERNNVAVEYVLELRVVK
jgi:hypothetical protein